MSRIAIRLNGGGDCDITHEPTGARILTSKSPAFGGSGASFSSTDLLAAALGSCIATDIEPVAQRHGIALDAIRIDVVKDVSAQPKAVRSLRVTVTLPASVDDVLMLKLERAAGHCLVHRSLHPDIDVSVALTRADAVGEAPSV